MATITADVEAGRAPRCGPAFGRLVLEIVSAANTAAGRGEPVDLPFAGRRDRTPHSLWRLPDDAPPPAAPEPAPAPTAVEASPPVDDEPTSEAAEPDGPH